MHYQDVLFVRQVFVHIDVYDHLIRFVIEILFEIVHYFQYVNVQFHFEEFLSK
jgi:hypothetical protein